MKDFLVKESSHIVIYGQTSLSKKWLRDENGREMFEFYFSEGRALDYLSIQKADALSESESSETEFVFHKLIANTSAPKQFQIINSSTNDSLRLDKTRADWHIRSNSKYVEINLTGMNVEQESPIQLKIFKIRSAEQGTIVLRVKDFRIIQKIDYAERVITLSPLYPAIPKMRDDTGVELIEEDEL